jgi:hypothetical protein
LAEALAKPLIVNKGLETVVTNAVEIGSVRLSSRGRLARRLLLAICGGGILVFSSVLVDSLSGRSAVRRAAETFVVGRLSEELGIEVGNREPAEIARVVDRMLADLPAPPRAWTVVRHTDLRDSRPRAEGAAHSGRGEADGGAYALRLRDLVHEVRVFAACNVTLFLLTGLLAITRRPSAAPCLIPAGLLGTATLVSIGVYIGARDWFWTFLNSDYVGLGYLSLVGIVLVFLMDTVFNGARITRLLLRLLFWVPV